MKLLTIPGAAKEFGFPYQTMLRLVNGGYILSLTIPGRRTRLVDPVDVQAFIDRAKAGTADGTESASQPAQVAPNKERQKRTRRAQNDDKYLWMDKFRRKGAPCS